MKNGLKKNSDFARVFNQGKRAYANNLMMFYIKSKALKAGFSVGKKHGNSVQRNYIKRRLRASFYDLSAQINGDYDVVFLPKVAEEYTYASFRASMLYLFKKEKLLKDD